MNGPGGANEEEKMNAKKNPLLMVLLFLMTALLLVGGCSRHYIDVYLDEECFSSTADLEHIKPLLLFPGDYVVFINTRVPPAPDVERWIELKFPEGLFEEDFVRIDPGKRVILKVIADGPMSGNIETNGPGCPLGDPEVKVGEGP